MVEKLIMKENDKDKEWAIIIRNDSDADADENNDYEDDGFEDDGCDLIMNSGREE